MAIGRRRPIASPARIGRSLLPMAHQASGGGETSPADTPTATLAAPRPYLPPSMEKLCPVPGCRVDHVTRLDPQAIGLAVHRPRQEARCPAWRMLAHPGDVLGRPAWLAPIYPA